MGLDISHDGRRATFAVFHEEMAAAEAHAVGVGDELHANAEIEHGIDGLTGMRQAVAQQRTVHRTAREVVHVGEDLVQGHCGVLLRLELRLAGRRATAHGEVGNGRRGARLDDDDLLAATRQIERYHEASRTSADDGHIAFLGLAALLARDTRRGRLARLAERFRGGSRTRRLRRAAGESSACSERAKRTETEKRATIHCLSHEFPPSSPPPQPALARPASCGICKEHFRRRGVSVHRRKERRWLRTGHSLLKSPC